MYFCFATTGLCLISVPLSITFFFLCYGYIPSFDSDNAFGQSTIMNVSSHLCYSILPLSVLITFLLIMVESIVLKKCSGSRFIFGFQV